MTFKVSDFTANIKTDLARPNLFEVSVDDMDLKFMCKATSIPGSTVGKVVVPYKNKKINLAGDREFEDWEITVMNDQEYEFRQKFEAWSAGIAGHDSEGGDVPSVYKKTATVTKINRDDSKGLVYTMVDIFPINISNIAQAFESNDEIEEYTVTFSIDYWINDATK